MPAYRRSSHTVGTAYKPFQQVSNVFSSMVYGERIAKFFETVSVIEPPRSGAAQPLKPLHRRTEDVSLPTGTPFQN
jgi:hypothetical protein